MPFCPLGNQQYQSGWKWYLKKKLRWVKWWTKKWFWADSRLLKPTTIIIGITALHVSVKLINIFIYRLRVEMFFIKSSDNCVITLRNHIKCVKLTQFITWLSVHHQTLIVFNLQTIFRIMSNISYHSTTDPINNNLNSDWSGLIIHTYIVTFYFGMAPW